MKEELITVYESANKFERELNSLYSFFMVLDCVKQSNNEGCIKDYSVTYVSEHIRQLIKNLINDFDKIFIMITLLTDEESI